MRSMILAALVLSPSLLHAQAIVPAQSKVAPVLEARLAESNLLAAATPAADHAAGTMTPLRVSTGVIAPKLVHTVDVQPDADWAWRGAGKTRTAVLSLVVDETGKPSEVKIVHSSGEVLDANVLAAVSHYRFKPATVSSMPIAVHMTLEVNVLNPLDR